MLKHVYGALGPEDATVFRALSARANHLAPDRPDIAFATKELCRCFAAPTREAFVALKQLCRYLIGAPRLVWDFPYQPTTDSLVAPVDTDFASCLSTRRSTSGGCVQHWSTTQSTVTLSPAEAELSGICRGSSQSLDLVSTGRDLGFQWDLTVHFSGA